MTEHPKAPILYTMFLPPSHPFWKMSDEEFERWAGPHVSRRVVEPMSSAYGERPLYEDGK